MIEQIEWVPVGEREVLAQYDAVLRQADAALGVECERIEPAKERANG